MFLKISGRGKCPVAIPLIAGSAIKTCQRHFETRAANVWDLVQYGQVDSFTKEHQLSRTHYVSVCTDGASAMIKIKKTS